MYIIFIKMKYLSLLLVSLFFTCTQADKDAILKTTSGKEIPLSFLKENTFVLIYSYECGYSLKSTPQLNQFKKKLESEVKENIHFVAFSETNKLETFEKYPEYSKLLVEDLDWDIIENENKFYLKLLKEEVYPQIIYFNKGKVVYRVEGVPYPNEYEEMINLAISKSH